jgi:hypothetical protein
MKVLLVDLDCFFLDVYFWTPVPLKRGWLNKAFQFDVITIPLTNIHPLTHLASPRINLDGGW